MRVYTYTPTTTWCREGVAVEHEPGHYRDTFWSTSDAWGSLTEGERATLALSFDTDQYRQIGGDYERGTPPAEWLTYDRADRERIPSQHGLQVRWYVRLGARPSLSMQVENARTVLDAAVVAADAAQRQLWRATERYADAVAALESTA